jgi:hypothetical protein
VTAWRHSRKGLITGEVVTELGDFVDIRITNEVNMSPLSREDDDWAQPGDIIRVRRLLITELADDA